jgi:membrane protein
MNKFINKYLDYVWSCDLDQLPAARARFIRFIRLLDALFRDLSSGQLNLRAMSLVYTTLLSLVPLLAVSFSILKAFGVHNQIEPMLLGLLSPLGEKGPEITSNIISFVENMKAGVLGSVGLAILLYTVISLLQKIERSFNYTWHVTEARSLGQRFSDYLSVILVGPVLVFSAIGVTASAMNNELVQKLIEMGHLGDLITMFTKLLPYFLIIVAFTFVYVFVPNTKVKIRHAFIGAVVAGLLWETVGWMFASVVVTSAKYTAVYSALATLILFMIWLYIGWLILLVGASIAFYLQHPEYLVTRSREILLSHRSKEKLALQVMYLVADNFYHNKQAWTVPMLSAKLHVPMELMRRIVNILLQADLLTATATEPEGFVPSRPLDQIRITQIFQIVRNADESPFYRPASHRELSAVEDVMQQIEQSVHDALHHKTLRQLLDAGMAAGDTSDIICDEIDV